ncbi:CDP-glycerol glycerophosphotransferase family protein [Gracilibacillus sp. HCP3S3_G5_1]|uniref:glycosyltransferase n=1 Tax=unclassified Gracilibacillus TaxID=2625209 RepID=UPI003F8A65BC
MHTYRKNYWTVYLELLDDFSELEYKGYPLVYLFHYGSLIRGNKILNKLLHDPAYTTSLKHPINNLSEIQQIFSKKKATIQRPFKKNVNGTIILHDVYDLLRFPNDTFYHYFDKTRTLILQDPTPQRKEKQYLVGLKDYKIESFDNYSKDVKGNIDSLQKKAQEILAEFPEHVVYRDSTFQKRLLMQIAKTVNRIEEAAKLFKTLPISTVIVPSTHYPESRTLVFVAAGYGIPTICMQHGIISSEFGYLPKIADIDAVYGQFEIDWYQKSGINKQGLEIIGHPRFDLINHSPREEQEVIKQKIGIDPTKKTILLIIRGQLLYQEWAEFLDLLKLKDDVNVIIKDFRYKENHPLLNNHSFVYASKGYHHYDLFDIADVVVSYSSTVALEAMLAKKPVFILNNSFPGYTGYYDNMGELVQSNPKQLAQLVSDYFTNKQLQSSAATTIANFLSQSYNYDIPSGERLIRLIKRLSH